jgi:hypothetical protein
VSCAAKSANCAIASGESEERREVSAGEIGGAAEIVGRSVVSGVGEIVGVVDVVGVVFRERGDARRVEGLLDDWGMVGLRYGVGMRRGRETKKKRPPLALLCIFFQEMPCTTGTLLRCCVLGSPQPQHGSCYFGFIIFNQCQPNTGGHYCFCNSAKQTYILYKMVWHQNVEEETATPKEGTTSTQVTPKTTPS